VKSAGRLVVARHTDEICLRTKSTNGVGHVRGATEMEVLSLELHHRHWRLRRDPVHAPDHELVEHDVADDEGADRRKAFDEAAKSVLDQAHQRAASSEGRSAA
jgi:hypothetical protein